MTFRTLFALAAFFDLDINQMDVKRAFFYDLIDQLIYMEIPKGTEIETTKNMVYKLLKALYGLKQISMPLVQTLFDLFSQEARLETYLRRLQYICIE